jgi:hypothetical protein
MVSLLGANRCRQKCRKRSKAMPATRHGVIVGVGDYHSVRQREWAFYRDGGDWTSGKIAMRSPRTEPSQSSLAT